MVTTRKVMFIFKTGWNIFKLFVQCVLIVFCLLMNDKGKQTERWRKINSFIWKLRIFSLFWMDEILNTCFWCQGKLSLWISAFLDPPRFLGNLYGRVLSYSRRQGYSWDKCVLWHEKQPKLRKRMLQDTKLNSWTGLKARKHMDIIKNKYNKSNKERCFSKF